MRFEWLFIACLLMLQLPVGNFTIFPLGGYLLMLFAFFKLARFEGGFKYSKRVMYVAIPIGIALLALQIYNTAVEEVPSWYELSYNLVRLASEFAEMTAMFFVYIAVKAMGVKAEFPSLEKHSSRNITVMFIYLALEVTITFISIFNPSLFTEKFKFVQLYPFALGLIWRMLNLWMIFTCYIGIMVDTDEKRTAREAKKAEFEAQEEKRRRELRRKRQNRKKHKR